jgi:MFS family permease
LVYVFNFIDRQILSILARIKADVISPIGDRFLHGTVFAAYAIFGIPLGRLADVWVRKSLIAIGLAFWSAMTALSGTARSFPVLGAYRIGVGVGEASATPAAFSSLVDWVPARLRATAISIYSSGVYIGAGIGIFLGGWIVDAWRAAFPGDSAPLGLHGWHVAYFAVGCWGPAAIWVAIARAAPRERGPEPARHPHPFGEFGRELMAVLLPLTPAFARDGPGDRAHLAVGRDRAAAGRWPRPSVAQWIAPESAFTAFSGAGPGSAMPRPRRSSRRFSCRGGIAHRVW